MRCARTLALGLVTALVLLLTLSVGCSGAEAPSVEQVQSPGDTSEQRSGPVQAPPIVDADEVIVDLRI